MVKSKALHSISVLLGTRKKAYCPQCESEEWHGQVEYISSGPVYKDANGEYGIDEGNKDYHCTTYYCSDCGHHED